MGKLAGKKHELSNGLTLMQANLDWAVQGKVPLLERTDFASETVSTF